ncbi:MAG: copper oxidase [Candidatus Neomarinimicrobiota bacterium]|nr:MAG: copper oxidase [Candidatus Neomarinimicrobiota bacterium]
MLNYLWINIVQTALRGLPFPTRTGLIPIGNPGRNSPVFLTCNFRLTVERVKRSLKGMDAWLLVANSRGINVWCAATGGKFTHHDVISILKTSGIEAQVDHRRVVLPQLAATGIEPRIVREKTGWHCLWGPVYAQDIPAFVRQNFHKTREQSRVRFSLSQRLEMAVMWAFPFHVISALILLFVWPGAILPLTLLLWGLSLGIFLAFPWLERWLNPQKKGMKFSSYTVLFDLSRLPLILWGAFLAGTLLVMTWQGTFTWSHFGHWALASFAIVLLLSIDLMGSTPTYKSGLHEDRFYTVELDLERCKGAGFCEQVCPRDVYVVDHRHKTASQPRKDLCVQCGACIVQCPFDALRFRTPDGDTIEPETIRTYKLNLLGQRAARI